MYCGVQAPRAWGVSGLAPSVSVCTGGAAQPQACMRAPRPWAPARAPWALTLTVFAFSVGIAASLIPEAALSPDVTAFALSEHVKKERAAFNATCVSAGCALAPMFDRALGHYSSLDRVFVMSACWQQRAATQNLKPCACRAQIGTATA